MTATFQRARTPEHKGQRRQAILDAAEKLGTRAGVRAVTLTDIAAEAGVHKSAVLRYFESREAVFLLLTADGWQSWAVAVEEALGTPTAPPRVASVLAGTLTARPLFCDLLAHAALHLERAVSEQAVRTYKVGALDAVGRAAGALRSAVPELDQDQSIDVVAGVLAMAASVWQTANPPETLAGLYTRDPALAHAAVEFEPRLERMAALLLLGATGPCTLTSDR